MSTAPSPNPVVLRETYPPTTHDVLVPSDLLRDEIDQRRESGFDVDDVVREANELDLRDSAAVLALADRMSAARRREDWPYQEPDSLPEITAALPRLPQARPADQASLSDRILSAWLGRIAGNNIGKPVELGDYWTVERIRDYLETAGAYPLRDYFPVIDPMPDRFQLRENWPHTTLGNVNGADRDDDIDYTILGLHLLETHGAALSPEHVGEAWLTLLPLRQVFTAERVAYANLVAGLTPRDAARHRNPYREWIGAQIRGDIFGYVYPGDPWAAASLAFQDASLSHVGNGIYGEMWAAALNAAAFTAGSAAEVVSVAAAVVPPTSRLAEALRHVAELHSRGIGWDECLAALRTAYGHYSWVHTINNAALVAAALLWSDDTYITAVGRVVMGGWDTDSNGATVGSVMGALCGTAALPTHVIEPLRDRTRSALFGFDHSRISALAQRTHSLAVHGLRKPAP